MNVIISKNRNKNSTSGTFNISFDKMASALLDQPSNINNNGLYASLLGMNELEDILRIARLELTRNDVSVFPTHHVTASTNSLLQYVTEVQGLNDLILIRFNSIKTTKLINYKHVSLILGTPYEFDDVPDHVNSPKSSFALFLRPRIDKFKWRDKNED